ncbi:MAG TPA: YciI family protein [Asanoa sp.]
MRYMILLYGSQQDYDVLTGKPTDKPPMSPEEVSAMHRYMEDFHKKLADSGELVDAQGLSAPVHARRVQLENRVPVVTDGPYPETQEVLAGYTIVECDSFDRATQIASGLVNPDAPGEYVDVRPIIDSVADLDL